MHYLDNYKTLNCYKVVYTNLDGLPSTMTLARTMIKNPKGWKRYRNACKKGIHNINTAVCYRDTIYVADRKKFSDQSNPKYILKGIKSALMHSWDKPVVIPMVYFEGINFKETVLSFANGNQVVFTDELKIKSK